MKSIVLGNLMYCIQSVLFVILLDDIFMQAFHKQWVWGHPPKRSQRKKWLYIWVALANYPNVVWFYV
jgi:hypothetical protein